ncbi:MAG: hypothetical protein ABIG28_00510 [archaeon]
MKKGFIFVIFLFCFSFASALEYGGVGLVWEEVEGNPQLEVDICPSWNCLGFADPTIAWAEDGRLLVWGSAAGENPYGPVIARVVSLDNGKSFHFNPSERGVIEALSPDDAEAKWDRVKETVFVRWNEDFRRWDMWYLGYSESFSVDPGFGFLSSLDEEGLEWEESGEMIYRPEKESWDFGFLTGPSVVKDDKGNWYLYYVGAGLDEGAGLLTSSDGRSWERYFANEPIFKGERGKWDEKIVDVSVSYIDGKFLMWYSGYSGELNMETTPISIGLAVSEDGVNFERVSDSPVVARGKKGKWNDLRVLDGDVVVEPDSSLLMAAYGNSLERAKIGSSDFKFGMTGFWRSSVGEVLNGSFNQSSDGFNDDNDGEEGGAFIWVVLFGGFVVIVIFAVKIFKWIFGGRAEETVYSYGNNV